MGASGGFPIDLVLFGMIAAFLVLRLRGILGKRTGFERQAPDRQAPDRQSTVQPVPGVRPAAPPTIDGRAEPVTPPVATTVPEAATPAGQALAGMRAIDRNFDAKAFLGGAEQAFRMIVKAFAAGDRIGLRALLADETYGAFEQAIAAREKSSETQVSEIKAILQLAIDSAELKGRTGLITLRIVSDQVSYTTDKDGKPLTGTDAVTEITDIWTFERDLSQQDPTWRLVAARSG